jgi:hypothetical protein
MSFPIVRAPLGFPDAGPDAFATSGQNTDFISSIAPSALAAMISRIRAKVAGGTAIHQAAAEMPFEGPQRDSLVEGFALALVCFPAFHRQHALVCGDCDLVGWETDLVNLLVPYQTGTICFF